MIVDPQVLIKTQVFQKPVPDPIGETVAGGLLFLEDHKWSKHRKIIAPAFHMNMVPAIRLSCSNMLEKWEAFFSGSQNTQEIDVWPYLEDLSGDVISRVAFSSSHEQGRRIFELQQEQVKLILEILQFIFIPGWRFVPTRANRRMKAMSKEIQSLLRSIIKQRENAMERGEDIDDDLLSTMMESNRRGNKKNVGMSIQDVINACRLFYFAGSETTSLLLVWTMVMLSQHQEWQDRAREEVFQVFGKSNEPTFDSLFHLKTVSSSSFDINFTNCERFTVVSKQENTNKQVTMILYEVLRLYPPVPLITRTPTKTVKLGDITLPVGVDMMLLIGLLHHDPEIWGDDVNEFKPERFSDGISGATRSQFSFEAFSSGPRVCIGQHFAMIEVKVALAMILQRFSFEISSSYVHAPFSILTLQPQHGAALLLHKL